MLFIILLVSVQSKKDLKVFLFFFMHILQTKLPVFCFWPCGSVLVLVLFQTRAEVQPPHRPAARAVFSCSAGKQMLLTSKHGHEQLIESQLCPSVETPEENSFTLIKRDMNYLHFPTGEVLLILESPSNWLILQHSSRCFTSSCDWRLSSLLLLLTECFLLLLDINLNLSLFFVILSFFPWKSFDVFLGCRFG